MSDPVHELKTWPSYFSAVWSRAKMFEVRLNDRNYQVGDRLTLIEWDQNKIPARTGRSITARISYVLHGGMFGISPDFCVLSLSEIANHE